MPPRAADKEPFPSLACSKSCWRAQEPREWMEKGTSQQSTSRSRDEQASSSCSDNKSSAILGKRHKARPRFHCNNGAQAPSSRASGNFQCSWKPQGKPSMEEDEESRLPEKGRGQGRRGELIPPQGSQAGSWKQSARQRGEAETGGVTQGGQRGRGPLPCPAHTHRRGTVTGVGVVLDFPQALVEAFSLVWFPIFVFIFFVKEQIFRAQEGAGERQSRGEAGAEAEPGGGSEAALTSRGCRRRRWGTCSGGVSRRRPRCHRSERKPKARGGQRQR